MTVPLDEKGFGELTKVADGLSVATGRSIEIAWHPNRPGTAILLHNDAAEEIVPHLVTPDRQFRFEWQHWNTRDAEKLLSPVDLTEPAPVATMPKGPIAILDPDLEQRQSKRASQLRDCQTLLEKGCGARPPVEGTPRKIGMISYVNSEYQFQRLNSVLQEWKRNLEEFGHHHVTMRICDDSQPPFSDRIQALLQTLSETGPNRFVYTGARQKAELSQELERELRKSLSAQDAAAVASLVAGPGPTQNRNLSLQFLGSEGGLQIDHDMTAEVLTKHFDKPLPYDLLGSLEQAPRNNLSSLRFCGADDHSIESIVGAALPQARNNAWLTVESREPEAPKRIQSLEDEGMGGSLRAPMNVPSNFSPAGRISPGLRDGDLALGCVAKNIAGEPTQELGESVFHRDTAGSRWGGASLLKEFLKFATVYRVFDGLRQKGPQTSQQLSQGLQKSSSGELPATEQLWCYDSSRESVSTFLSERQSKVAELKEMLSNSNYPRSLESWAGQPLTPKLRKQSTAEIRQVIQKLEAESQEMREKLHLDQNGQIDVQALQTDLHNEVRQILHTHALALAQSQQISSTILSKE